MELRQMKYFLKAAELENLTQAAKSLHMAQPNLSLSISKLEEELSVKLFDRAGKHIVLNEKGKIAENYMKNIFSTLDNMKKELMDQENQENSRLEIATNVGLYMPKLIKLFIQEYPNIQIHQSSVNSTRIHHMLLNNEADFAIGMSISQFPHPDLDNCPLFKERLCLLVPEGHPLLQKKSVCPEDLNDLPLITSSPKFAIRIGVDEFLKKHNIQMNIIVETTDTTAIWRYVLEGIGVAFTPESSLLDSNLPVKHWLPIVSAEKEHTIHLIWNKKRYQNHTMRAFKSFAIDYFKEKEKQLM